MGQTVFIAYMSGFCFWIKVRDVAWPSSQLAFTFANSVTELNSSTMFELLVGFERILSRIIIKKKDTVGIQAITYLL